MRSLLLLDHVSDLSHSDSISIQSSWFYPRNVFHGGGGGGGIYCYANFYCYSIVFGPNFREGQKFSRGGGGKLPQGAPPCGRKPGSDKVELDF